MPPTVGTLDSMANEALRDVREGVKAYEFLLQNNELESATKRLAEAFTVGEYRARNPHAPARRKSGRRWSSSQKIESADLRDWR